MIPSYEAIEASYGSRCRGTFIAIVRSKGASSMTRKRLKHSKKRVNSDAHDAG